MLGDNWGNALLQGQQFGQNDIDQNYLNAAHAANVAKYGPQAGDPAAMASLQATNFLAQDQPSTLRTLQGNANIVDAQGQVAQGTIGSDITARRATNVGIAAMVPAQVDNANSTAAASQAAARQATLAANAAASQAHVKAASVGGDVMQSTLAANPGDTATAWDTGVNAIRNTVSPEEAASLDRSTPTGAAAYAHFVKDPAAAIQDFRNLTTANYNGAINAMAPDKRAEWLQTQAKIQNDQADVRTKAQASLAAAKEDENKILANQGPVGAGVVQGDSALNSIAELRKDIAGLGGATTANSLLSHLPGSKVQQIESLAKSVNSAISLGMMAGVRAGGGSMGMKTTNTEFGAIGDSFANIDPTTMTPAQLLKMADSAEAAIRDYQTGAKAMLAGPDGSDAYKGALARRIQIEKDLNQNVSVLPESGAASAASPTQPAAPASPSGAAAQPVPRLGADAAPAPQANPIGTFNAALQHTFGAEGGYNDKDANGAPVNMGINAAAHPGVDVANLTHDKATQIYKSEYWDAIGGDQLAKTSPGLAHAGFDIAVVDGAPKAKELIAKAGGDPNKLVDLQQQFQNNLIARDPSRYGKYADTWARRNAALKADIASGTVGNSYVATGAPDAHALANGGATGSWPIQPITPLTPPTPIVPSPMPQQAQQPAPEPRQQASAQSPAAQAAPAQAQALASATYDPITGTAARAFQGQRSAVMDGRALLAKYLRDVA